MEHPQEILRRFTLDDIYKHRDSEWIAKERSYHETAISKLNVLVRNYNGLAPYAVRRAYYTQEAEIDNLYKECAPTIIDAIAERETEKGRGYGRDGVGDGSAGGLAAAGGVLSTGRSTLLDWLRLVFRRLFGIRT